MGNKLKIILLHAVIAFAIGLPLVWSPPAAVYAGLVSLYLWEVSQAKGGGMRLENWKDHWLLAKQRFVFEVLIPIIVAAVPLAALNSLLF